jgi:hypothetical protein
MSLASSVTGKNASSKEKYRPHISDVASRASLKTPTLGLPDVVNDPQEKKRVN